MKKIWQIKEKKYDDVINQILYNRGVISFKDRFLSPDFNCDFHNPEKLPDFFKAIKRINLAIKNKEKIGIFADYDADGIPGVALLYKTFKKFDLEVEVYIPTREIGYGFSQSGIDYLIARKCKLIISVDLGIKEIELSEYIKSKKIDLIITDHHLPGEELPEAIAIVDPKRLDSKYPFSELSGCGVVYKIIQGLAKSYPTKITDSFLKWNLDLVAISTISDVVPLIDENRLIAKFGLLVLKKTRNLGIEAICQQSRIDQSKINAYSVGFQIGPRINAPGRINQATQSYKILITEDKKEAYNLAKYIDDQNQKRQKSMEVIYLKASLEIRKKNLTKDKILILSGADWSKGVIGPVASRLAESFFRPVILFREEKDLFVGSARSIYGFNIVEALEKVEQFIIGFGGHSGAAGVRIKKTDFKHFVLALTKVANSSISDKDLLPKIAIDLELPKNRINISLFKDLEKLEPFGMGNPKLIFLTKSLRLKSHRFVGKDNKHLQLIFSEGTREFKAISFNSEITASELKSGLRYDIVYNPGVNYWNGKNYIDLRLVDIKAGENNGQK